MADEPWGFQAINDRLRKTVENQARTIVRLEEEVAHLKSERNEAFKRGQEDMRSRIQNADHDMGR